ncbi:OmpA family protein [Acerihabitans arboris]|uniref:OmpA family protein n=1 Tax=Acerihabitans arboris TaxID=2691583 RepID=A0A845SGH9_9GAMM|nr:OmpA family protein [Acerihabitans arboris]NDL64183.1 OmpA family protein [Acerihabitans arboris]
MSTLTRSLLILLATCLALWLVLSFWQPRLDGRVVLVTLVLLMAGGALFFARRQTSGRRDIGLTVTDNTLPPEDFMGAVVLVCGDTAALFPAGEPYRQTSLGWYLPVGAPEQLLPLAGRIADTRPALAAQVALLLAVVPERHRERDALSHSLHAWHRAVVACRRVLPGPPPLLVSTWLTPPDGADSMRDVWLAATPAGRGVQIFQPGQGELSQKSWSLEALPAEREARFYLSLWLDSLLTWADEHVDNILGQRQGTLPALTPCARGWNFTPINALAGNLWQRHLCAVTRLAPPGGQSHEAPPLPDCLLATFPRRRGISIKMRAWRMAGLICGVFLLLALASSYHHNRRLLQNTGDRLALYRQLDGQPAGPKLRAQALLRRDADFFEAWQRGGEPARFGLGLYQGMRLIAPLRAAISDWAPPVINKIPPGPKTVRLDSLSLFDTGKWQLKPGSTRVLVNALVSIKAKPGWLTLVAGHTDNIGNSAANQQLSLKRAQAVRDWMRDTGDVPESCFAVQGYGESRPLKTNDTAEGRAANRRVEISLVPQADTCRIPDATIMSPQDGGDTDN